MIGFLFGILTWLPVLSLIGGAGAIGVLIAPFASRGWSFVARWGGVLLIALFCLCAGYRLADEQAELNRLKAENANLQDQLAHQKSVAEFASGERDRLRDEKTEADRKVADYEQKLQAQPVGACSIDDADLRFRDSLRRPRRK